MLFVLYVTLRERCLRPTLAQQFELSVANHAGESLLLSEVEMPCLILSRGSDSLCDQI